MILFIGIARLKEDKVEDVDEAIQRFLPILEEEEGTLVWRVYKDPNDPTKILFYEKYRDQAARKAHGGSHGLKEFLAVLSAARDEVIMGTWEEYASIESKE